MARRVIRFLPLVLIGVAAAFTGAGCGGSGNPASPPSADDQSIIQDLVTGGSGSDSTASWFDLQSMMGGDSGGPSPSLPLEPAPIQTRHWWRVPVLPFTHSITTTIVGDSAYVHAVTTMTGTLHLVVNADSQYTKPFTDLATRNAVFHKFADSTSIFRGGWRLSQISNVHVSSSPDPTVVIDSILVTPLPAGVPHLITDPLALQHRSNVIRLGAADSVMVRVYTHGDSARAFVNTGRGTGLLPRRPIPEDPSNNHVFQGVWKAPDHPGVYQAAVNVIRYETLYDNDGAAFPYDSDAWLLIYTVGILNP